MQQLKHIPCSMCLHQQYNSSSLTRLISSCPLDVVSPRLPPLRPSSPSHLLQQLLAGLNLLLPCQEDEHVSRGLRDVDLKRGHHRCVQVIGLRVGRRRVGGIGQI